MQPLKIYISHSIRGKYGIKATAEQMQENCDRAIKFCKWLEAEFPQVNWYCPGTHDEFVSIAYRLKYLTEHQILDVDCRIIKQTCNGVLFYMFDDHFSRGMNTEHTCATNDGKPMLFAPSHLLEHKQMLKYAITNWLDTMGKNGKNNR